jgi:predicted Rossmann-fold nucleotide-binding protein
VIMFDSSYWCGFLDWLKGTVLAKGAISEEDFELLRVFDEPDDVVKAVLKWYTRQEVTGKKALQG